jgi:hypothetical protein
VSWREDAPFLAQQLVAEDGRLDHVRARIRGQGVYGRVSAVPWDGRHLPYPDNTVNLLVLPDGAAAPTLAWRFRAAPEPLWIASDNRMESVWPVHGSVLVVHDVLVFTAGRSSYLDGGIHWFALDPHSARVIAHRVIDSRASNGAQAQDDVGIVGCLNDVLSSDGSSVFMRHQAFDLHGHAREESAAHLHSPDGFLMDDTTTRLLWTYAPHYTSLATGATRDNRLSRTVNPSGQILVEDEAFVYGFGQNFFPRPSPSEAGEWAVFRAPKKQENVPRGLSPDQYRALAEKGAVHVGFNWWRSVPVNVWAMMKSEDAVFVAGPIRRADDERVPVEAFAGTAESKLLSLSASDGTPLAELSLPGTPVWDGMAAAGGRIFVALRDGRIVGLDARTQKEPGGGRKGSE